MSDNVIYLSDRMRQPLRSDCFRTPAPDQNNFATRVLDHMRTKAVEKSSLKIGDQVFSEKHRRSGTVTGIDIDVNTRQFLRLYVDFVSFQATLRPGEFKKRYAGG